MDGTTDLKVGGGGTNENDVDAPKVDDRAVDDTETVELLGPPQLSLPQKQALQALVIRIESPVIPIMVQSDFIGVNLEQERGVLIRIILTD